MTPEAVLRIALFAAEELLAVSPEAFARLQALFAKPGVTVEDLRAERDQIAGQHYSDFVKDSSIPPEQRT